jgi:hypothetical protein
VVKQEGLENEKDQKKKKKKKRRGDGLWSINIIYIYGYMKRKPVGIWGH